MRVHVQTARAVRGREYTMRARRRPRPRPAPPTAASGPSPRGCAGRVAPREVGRGELDQREVVRLDVDRIRRSGSDAGSRPTRSTPRGAAPAGTPSCSTQLAGDGQLHRACAGPRRRSARVGSQACRMRPRRRYGRKCRSFSQVPTARVGRDDAQARALERVGRGAASITRCASA